MTAPAVRGLGFVSKSLCRLFHKKRQSSVSRVAKMAYERSAAGLRRIGSSPFF